MPRPLIVALCTQKGGVGKTSVGLGLADALTAGGAAVLLVDLDPQSNATARLGLDDPPPFTTNDILAVDKATGRVTRGGVMDAYVPAGEHWHNLDLVGAENALAEREQDQHLGREYRLREALDDDATSRWDVVLIDCPPSLGQLTINALTAAHAALLVSELGASSVEGLAAATRTLAGVVEHFNDQLRLAGVVVNKYRPDRRDRAAWLAELVAGYGDRVLQPYLPERELVAVAATESRPISSYGSRGRDLTEAFAAIAKTITATGE